MIIEENHCCSCANDTYPCYEGECELLHVQVLRCDKCNEKVDTLYVYNGQELCADCLLATVDKVKI